MEDLILEGSGVDFGEVREFGVVIGTGLAWSWLLIEGSESGVLTARRPVRVSRAVNPGRPKHLPVLGRLRLERSCCRRTLDRRCRRSWRRCRRRPRGQRFRQVYRSWHVLTTLRVRDMTKTGFQDIINGKFECTRGGCHRGG